MNQTGLSALDGLLREAVVRGLAPAVTVAIVNRERELFVGAAGMCDVAAGAVVAPGAIFRMASMTKPVTSLAAMMLVEEGRIGLDDPVSAYLPDFRDVRVMTAFNDADATFESRPAVRAITIRHLLTHTSGIVYAFMASRLSRIGDGSTSQTNLPLLFDPGERFGYGPSTIVLGSVVERVSGHTLGEFFRTRIFEPLEMADTGFSVPPEKHDRVVTQHTRSGGGFIERPNPPTVQSRGRGDDGLFSTAADYGRFMRLFLNDGSAGARQLAKPTTIRAMTVNQIGALRLGAQPPVGGAFAKPFPLDGSANTFGFGFQIQMASTASADPDRRSVGSYWWEGIFNTYFWIDPRQQIAAAVLMQFLPAYDGGAVEILRSVERLVYRTLRAAT